MKSKILTLAALVLLSFGCSNKMDANKQNFSAAIAKNLEKNGDLCFKTRVWPVQIPKGGMNSFDNKFLQEMAGLEKAGLVNIKDGTIRFPGWDEKMHTSQGKIYEQTDAAKPFSHTRFIKQLSVNGDHEKVPGAAICWGKLTLDQVTKWDMPMKFGEHQELTVYWNAKLTNLAAWILKPEVVSYFPQISERLNALKTQPTAAQKSTLVLTSNGWEVR